MDTANNLGSVHYIYQDLEVEAGDENHWGVRLVTIEGGVPGSDIVCTLSYTTLSQCKGQFEALSYLWGDSNQLKDITLDGVKFRVTINLHAALNGLRRKKKSRTLWIDAICIDQSNMLERALQVQKMGTLYSYATRVTAWLGEEADDSNEAFAVLGKLDQLEGDEAIAKFVESTPDSKWQAFDTLTQRPYFGRVWMAQEVAVNRETYIVCGEETAAWDLLISAVEKLFSYNYYRPTSNSHVAQQGFGSAWALSATREYYQNNINNIKNLSLVAVLALLRQNHATDPRDKIFSVLRFSGNLKPIAPDYTASLSGIFQHVVRSYIDIESLDILGYCNEKVQPDLPSWCPDWTSLGSTAYRLLCRFYNAGRGTKPVASISDGILTINGVILDEIERLWGPPPQNFTHASFTKELLMELETVVTRVCSQGTSMDEKTRQAFRRTIVADLKWEPDDMKHITNLDEAYEAWAAYVSLPDLETSDGRVLNFQRAVDLAFIEHQFAVTTSGIFALVSRNAKIGDSLAVFRGGDVPYCISKEQKGATSEDGGGRKETKERYTFLGECYVDGFMQGKAIDEVESGARRLEDIELM